MRNESAQLFYFASIVFFVGLASEVHQSLFSLQNLFLVRNQ